MDRIPLIGFVLASTLVLGGCGGDDENSSSTSGTVNAICDVPEITGGYKMCHSHAAISSTGASFAKSGCQQGSYGGATGTWTEGTTTCATTDQLGTCAWSTVHDTTSITNTVITKTSTITTADQAKTYCESGDISSIGTTWKWTATALK